MRIEIDLLCVVWANSVIVLRSRASLVCLARPSCVETATLLIQMSLADLSVEKTASSPDRDRGRASRAAARPTRYRASPNGSSDPASMRIRRRHSRSSASSRAVSAAPSGRARGRVARPPGKTLEKCRTSRRASPPPPPPAGRPPGRPGTTARAPWRWPRSPSGRTRGARASSDPGGSSRRRAGPRAARAVGARRRERARGLRRPCLRGEDLTLRLDARAHVGGRPRGRRGCPHRVRARARVPVNPFGGGDTTRAPRALVRAQRFELQTEREELFQRFFRFSASASARARFVETKSDGDASFPSFPPWFVRSVKLVGTHESERGVRCVRSSKSTFALRRAGPGARRALSALFSFFRPSRRRSRRFLPVLRVRSVKLVGKRRRARVDDRFSPRGARRKPRRATAPTTRRRRAYRGWSRVSPPPRRPRRRRAARRARRAGPPALPPPPPPPPRGPPRRGGAGGDGGGERNRLLAAPRRARPQRERAHDNGGEGVRRDAEVARRERRGGRDRGEPGPGEDVLREERRRERRGAQRDESGETEPRRRRRRRHRRAVDGPAPRRRTRASTRRETTRAMPRRVRSCASRCPRRGGRDGVRARPDPARARYRQTRLGRGEATRGGPRASRGADARVASRPHGGRRRGRRGRGDPGGESGTHGGRAGGDGERREADVRI